MLLIPIGLRENEVRRQPWISYGIIGANLLVFLWIQLVSLDSSVPARMDAKADEVARYLVENPYLEIPPDLLPFCDGQTRAVLEQARVNYLAAARKPDDWYVQRQQEKLNDMTADLFAISRESPVQRFGFVPRRPEAAAVLTSMFVHAGWLHLLGNMLFFFVTGPFLEDLFGRPLFTLLYLFSGAAAVAAHTWQHPASALPLIGASGAIAGVMGAFLIRLGSSRIRFLWLPIPVLWWLRVRFFIPAFIFLPFWFLVQFWLANQAPAGAGVAFWAHVGGFAFGAAVALTVAATGLEKRWIHPAIEGQISWTQNPTLIRAMEAGAHGDLQTARRTTGRVLAEDPSNIDAWRYAYEVSLQEEDWKELAKRATRLLEIYLRRGEKELAHELIDEASRHAMQDLPTKFHLRAASFLEQEGHRLLAVKFYTAAADRAPQEPGALRCLVRCADIHTSLRDLGSAKQVLLRALQHPDCRGPWKETVQQKLEALERSAAAKPGPVRHAPHWTNR